MKTLSLVMPVYNEEEILPHIFQQVTDFLNSLDNIQASAVLVDDGSSDRSWSLMKAQHERDPRFKVVRLSRNFGHQLALSAGLDVADGDAVVALDADLQNPLSAVRGMIREWEAGHKIVYGRRLKRGGETWFKRTTAHLFYKLIHKLSRDPTPDNVGDFYLLSREALTRLRAMREHHRYLRGMIFWLGYAPRAVPYSQEPRCGGRSKFSLLKMTRFALDAIASSSSLPLHLASYLGVASALAGLIVALWCAYAWLQDAASAPRWAAVIAALLFLGGIQLLTVGVLGVYVARIHDEAKSRPLYVIDEQHTE